MNNASTIDPVQTRRLSCDQNRYQIGKISALSCVDSRARVEISEIVSWHRMHQPGIVRATTSPGR